jgi:hypothetical protein
MDIAQVNVLLKGMENIYNFNLCKFIDKHELNIKYGILHFKEELIEKLAKVGQDCINSIVFDKKC